MMRSEFRAAFAGIAAALAPYDRPLKPAAVDAGADTAVGHHACILRGIGVDSGRPGFPGLGNGSVAPGDFG